MRFLSRLRNVVLSLTALPLAAASAAEPPSAPSLGPELREQFLVTSAADAGISPSARFPSVYGVSMDFFVDENVATVIALSDGSASVYTTSSFGIIGGIGHAAVRKAARRFVTVAARYADAAVPISTHPYPAAGKVRFYFLTYDGLRSVETDAEPIVEGDSSPFIPLYGAGQDVLTELLRTRPKE
ncbi:MAG: hypothetical protein J0H86_15690 [Xanthomonadaceae bacterium]|nr:hypothetical protein [Xanthomonadaceae bacterium]